MSESSGNLGELGSKRVRPDESQREAWRSDEVDGGLKLERSEPRSDIANALAGVARQDQSVLVMRNRDEEETILHNSPFRPSYTQQYK